ncbi:unannotated protein [freshwater metagenome]|uniref:Unannotated protein n=1 Tax=freshwater metagenome TaxID=449393 RepID=A0A6J6G7P0_9ZZZZ
MMRRMTPPCCSMSSGPMLSWQFPNASTQVTSQRKPSPYESLFSTVGSGTRPGITLAVSTSIPTSSSAPPLQRNAATGANTSRPANVAPGASRCKESLVNSNTRSAPPVMAAADARSPLSGPSKIPRPSAISMAMARRVEPTPGSTTAITTPGGTY